jgi:hypothetical protein
MVPRQLFNYAKKGKNKADSCIFTGVASQNRSRKGPYEVYRA